MPDGPQQQQRDQFLGSKPLGAASQWDGKNVDDPPEGKFNPLTFPYMSGFDVIDHVSFPPSKGVQPFKRLLTHLIQTKRRLEEILGQT